MIADIQWNRPKLKITLLDPYLLRILYRFEQSSNQRKHRWHQTALKEKWQSSFEFLMPKIYNFYESKYDGYDSYYHHNLEYFIASARLKEFDKFVHCNFPATIDLAFRTRTPLKVLINSKEVTCEH